jgi:hypothetical protein
MNDGHGNGIVLMPVFFSARDHTIFKHGIKSYSERQKYLPRSRDEREECENPQDGIAFLATFAPSRFNLFGSGLSGPEGCRHGGNTIFLKSCRNMIR